MAVGSQHTERELERCKRHLFPATLSLSTKTTHRQAQDGQDVKPIQINNVQVDNTPAVHELRRCLASAPTIPRSRLFSTTKRAQDIEPDTLLDSYKIHNAGVSPETAEDKPTLNTAAALLRQQGGRRHPFRSPDSH